MLRAPVNVPPSRSDARAWVEVDLAAVLENARTLARLSGTRLLPVVKADAYGTGAVAVSRALEAVDPWGFAVATIDEGCELRAAGVTRPILVLIPARPESFGDYQGAKLTATLGDGAAVHAWRGRGAAYHLEIDSGMNRTGVKWDAIGALVDALDIEQLRGAVHALDPRQPLLVLCEGLMGYLTRAETKRVATNIRALLGDHGGGSWIVPDFTFVTEIRNLPPERLRLRTAVTGITERQLDASAFENHDDLVSFFGGIGFATRASSQIDETPSFASLAALGLPASLLDRLRPILRVWVMTPR